MPRFVILEHQLPAGSERPTHWDLMLESNSTLRTWALADEPSEQADIAADALPDHRQAYLEYEGPVSENRGSVRRWDRGDYLLQSETPQRITVTLNGSRLTCRVQLTCCPQGGQRWTASFRPLGSSAV